MIRRRFSLYTKIIWLILGSFNLLIHEAILIDELKINWDASSPNETWQHHRKRKILKNERRTKLKNVESKDETNLSSVQKFNAPTYFNFHSHDLMCERVPYIVQFTRLKIKWLDWLDFCIELKFVLFLLSTFFSCFFRSFFVYAFLLMIFTFCVGSIRHTWYWIKRVKETMYFYYPTETVTENRMNDMKSKWFWCQFGIQLNWISSARIFITTNQCRFAGKTDEKQI